jgi:hypothetical protein
MSFLSHTSILEHAKTKEFILNRLSENMFISEINDYMPVGIGSGTEYFNKNKNYIGIINQNDFKIRMTDHKKFRSYFTIINGIVDDKKITIKVNYSKGFIGFIFLMILGEFVCITRILSPNPNDAPYLAHFFGSIILLIIILTIFNFKKITENQIQQFKIIFNNE